MKKVSSELKRCSYTPEYKVWNNLKNRCTNPNIPGYKNYGGRGINFCKEWNDFANFIKDMGIRPSLNHSLDRINNNKNYCKDNCRWATKKEQVRNRRSNILIQYKGQERILKDIAIEVGLNYQLLQRRMSKGLSIEESINKQYKYRKNVILL
jgi:predicted nucleic acid-binding Zn ribbon protein